MKYDDETILNELGKTEAIAQGLLEQCFKIRTLIAGKVSTSPKSQHLKSVGAAVVAKRRARKH